MSVTLEKPPVDETITLDELTRDPYPIYRRLRRETPIVRVPNLKRTFITRAEDTKFVKDHPELFSSNDPSTPMAEAFQAHTLMRKDGPEHLAERNAMMPAFLPKTVMEHWIPLYKELAAQYLDRLPKGETIDLFSELCGPIAARILAHILGIPDATDEEMQRWSQTLIDGAGNFAYRQDLFDKSDRANDEMNAHFDAIWDKHVADPGPSAFSVMVNADNPIPKSQIYANIKIAIGGGINEPRDALATIIYGLLTNPEQLDVIRQEGKWGNAFEEGVRWVAPIQVSARVVREDMELHGVRLEKDEILTTCQASANRDEDLYEDGESYNCLRANRNHQSFGSGPHHCAGVHIARRTVGQIMLPLIFERFPDMKLPDPDAVIWKGFGFRGPINLPVTLQ